MNFENGSTVMLQDIVTKLGDGLHGTPKYNESGEYYFINGSNLKEGKIVTDISTKRVDRNEYDKYKKQLNENTILLGINGTIGNVAIYNHEKCILGKSACYFNVNEDVANKLFLKYVLMSSKFQNYLHNTAGGTTIKNVSLKSVREFEFYLPSIHVQNKIASILSSLDDKIELNRQTNKTLEAIAQALFEEWFVDFNFPGATGEMLESKLGMIPREWSVANLLEVAQLIGGGTPKTSTDEYWNGQVEWLSAKDVTQNNHSFAIESEKKITELGLANSSAKLVPELATVITARGTVGSYCLLSKPMTISQSNYALKAKEGYGDYFIYLNVQNSIALIQKMSYGTIFDTITTETLRKINIVIPNTDTLELFESILQHVFKTILNNTIQNRTLIELRDGLLPNLLNNKIKV